MNFPCLFEASNFTTRPSHDSADFTQRSYSSVEALDHGRYSDLRLHMVPRKPLAGGAQKPEVRVRDPQREPSRATERGLARQSVISENYVAADPVNDDDSDSEHSGAKGDPGWTSAGVWCNYNGCDLSCDNGTGFRLCTEEQINPDFLDGLEIEVDMQRDLDDPGAAEPAFTIHLLGRDSVRFHRVKFERLPGSDKFKILWSGKIALSYRSDSDFKFDFKALVENVGLPEAKAENKRN